MAAPSTVRPDTNLLGKLMNPDGILSKLVEKYNIMFTIFLSVSTISVLVLLFVNISKLSASADNDFRRKQAISGILVCLICLAVIGGIDTVYAIALSFVFGG